MRLNIFNRHTKCDDIAMTVHELAAGLVHRLQPYYRGNTENAAGQHLTLWLTDQLLTAALKTELEDGRLKAEIAERLLVELGIAFNTLTIIDGDVPEGVSAEAVVDAKMYFSIDRGEPAVAVHVASVSISGAQGSLYEEEYTLTSDEVQRLPAHRYNIGCGREHALEHGGFRINHIAIDNRPGAVALELNRRVSRSHAHITHDPEHGFLLHVEARGTRMAGSRTQIFRNEAMIDVDNPRIPVVLRDGDIIILAKSVYLHFSQLQ